MDSFIEFLKNKEAILQIGTEVFYEVVVAYQQKLSGQLKPFIQVSSQPDTYINDLKNLYNSLKFTDIDFQITEANILGLSGTVFKAHKFI